MASNLHVEVKGLNDLVRNLATFGDDKVVGRIIRSAMAAGARIVKTRTAGNARTLGLGFQGYRINSRTNRIEKRYGRIPRAIKAGRTYIPAGLVNLYRLNVVARGQRDQGIYRNRAPHAHLIEYGFNHWRGGHVAGRPFAAPAITQTAVQVVEKIRDHMAARIDALRFPT